MPPDAPVTRASLPSRRNMATFQPGDEAGARAPSLREPSTAPRPLRGYPRVLAAASGAILRTRPLRTRPAPSSTKLSTPSEVIICTDSRQRTVAVTWRTSSSRIAVGSVAFAAPTLETTGIIGGRISACSSAAAISAAAGAINAQ